MITLSPSVPRIEPPPARPTAPSDSVPQVPLLTESQIAQFKRDGFVLLPSALDPELCRRARDAMWEALARNRPGMKRDDPSTWTPITDDEAAAFPVTVDGGRSFFGGNGHRFFVRNGTEEFMLDLGPRALWQVAQQLLGEGTVVWPAGVDESGSTIGPCFMDDSALEVLYGQDLDVWPRLPTFKTEDLRLPTHGLEVLTGQGTRGLYCTLPNSPSPGANWRGAHSDGPSYGRARLNFSAYVDDLPAAAGGFTVWPGSHKRIWTHHWKTFHAGETHVGRRDRVRKLGGYDFLVDPILEEVKADTEAVDCHGPAGTVVLWHHKLLHVPGQNQTSDVIRQATIYGYHKTPEALPDELVVSEAGGDIWRDWSDEVCAIDEGS